MKDSLQIKGVVERQLFDANGNVKKQFKDNFIWKAIHDTFGIDLQIPMLTGYWTTKAIKHNTITTIGKQVAAQQLGGTTTTPATYLAIGIGTGGTTTLNSEITTNGGARHAATVTNTTTSTTGDTEQWLYQWTFSGSFAITEEGILDAASSGNLIAYQTFAAVNVISSDKFQITHQIKFS